MQLDNEIVSRRSIGGPSVNLLPVFQRIYALRYLDTGVGRERVAAGGTGPGTGGGAGSGTGNGSSAGLASLYFNRGLVYVCLGDDRSALDDLGRALARDPRNIT